MRLPAIIALCLFALAACGESPPPSPAEGAPRIVADPNAPLGQLPDDVRPVHYRLDLTLKPEEKHYSGIVEIDVELTKPARAFYLHGEELDVTDATARLADRTVKGVYTQVHATGVAKLTFEEELPAGKATVRLPFKTTFNTEPDALTSMSDSGAKYAWTQFEAISARRAFPSFDEPRFKTRYDITVTALARDTVVTNTPPVNEETLDGGLKKITFATTEPLPTYLIAFAVGPYDVTEGPTLPPTRMRPREVPLRGITVAGKGDRVRFALVQTPPQLRYLEDYFAAPFPYPKLDLITPPNFLAGGMENAGAITYTERGILLDETASVRQKRYFTLLHAHELAHQWFGDLVTPKWWNDIWLNESFATWMGNKTSAAVWPEGEFARETIRDALDVMDIDALSTARAIRQPIASNGDIANAFDGLTYDKGGGVLAMFESYLGADAFREGVRTHMRRFAHGTADVRDFMESLAQGSGKPEIVPAFETFLNQPGVPLVRVKTSCEGRNLNVDLAQSPYGAANVEDQRLWSVPVCMRNATTGRALGCTLLSTRTARQSYANQCGALVMPNADGAGYYRFSMSRDDWKNLGGAIGKLPPSEQLATLHSLRAAFRAGDADAATYLSAFRALAETATWDVVDLMQVFLGELRGDLLPRAEVPVFEQQARAWFTPGLTKIGLEPRQNERPAASLARAKLAELLVKVAREPTTIAPLAAQGATYLRAISQGDANAKAPQAELLPVALWAAVFTGGEQVARDAMSAIKASSEAEFRLAAITALTAARDPKAIAEIEEFVASGALRVRETRSYLRDLFADAERRAGAWAWLRRDFKRLTEPVPPDSHARFIALTATLCTDQAHAEIEWYFKPMVDKIVGAPRIFANTIESVDRCVTWRKAQSGELAKALKAL